jgi:hypothetical protein
MAKNKNKNNWAENVMGELQDSTFFKKTQEEQNEERKTEENSKNEVKEQPRELNSAKSAPEEQVRDTSVDIPQATVVPSPKVQKSTDRINRGFHITEEQSKKLDRVEKKILSTMKKVPIGKSVGRSAIVRYLIETMDESDEFIEQVRESIIEEVMAKYR